jgi:phosphoglycerate kinase
MFHKKTIDDVELKGKRVLMRVDFNVPLDEQCRIVDDERIVASLPTIRKVLDSGATLILMSHLGRPGGRIEPKLSLKPVAAHLSGLLNRDVTMASDSIGPDVARTVQDLSPGGIVLLENLRFHPEEKDNDPAFARVLSSYAELYVNDAFGTAHRAHASTEGVTRFIHPSVAGYLLEKEMTFLGNAVENPRRPFLAILGGAKISGKIEVIRTLARKVDAIAIGGGMAFTFFRAQDHEVGNSLVEEDRIQVAADILEEVRIEFLLPRDVIIADAFSNDAACRTVRADAIPEGWWGMDIGPDTCKRFEDAISRSNTIVWNGPMGVFEMPNFTGGTRRIAEAIGRRTSAGATTIIGGGDSVTAVKQMGYKDKVTHLSTGGGASLEFLEGKELPGIASLDDRDDS